MKKAKKYTSFLLTLLLTAMAFSVFLPGFSGTAHASGRNLFTEDNDNDRENSENETEEDDGLLAPYFLIQSQDTSLDAFPLKSTQVTVNINGIIAETYVVQTYANEGDTPINARYVFPTAPSVTVHGMTMQIGDNIVTAKIKEKEEAKAEYEEAKSEGKSASLLEQKRPNVFTMDVANIMPGDTALIELHYTELITPSDSIYEFVFPTVVGPRYAPDETRSQEDEPAQIPSLKHVKPTPSPETESEQEQETEDEWVASPYLAEGELPPNEYQITVNLSTGVPIGDVSCKSHDINVAMESDSKACITLANPQDYAGNRDFILKYRLTGEEVQSGLVLTGSGDEKYFMLTVQPPERFVPEEIPPREYIFVLDVSGSMYGYPLETAKDLIRKLVSGLRETDTFNLVLFSDDTIRLSPESLQATEKNISYAIELIDEKEGGG